MPVVHPRAKCTAIIEFVEYIVMAQYELLEGAQFHKEHLHVWGKLIYFAPTVLVC